MHEDFGPAYEYGFYSIPNYLATVGNRSEITIDYRSSQRFFAKKAGAYLNICLHSNVDLSADSSNVS